MGDDLRIGVIGCGAVGELHMDVWARTPGARVTAICDVNAERACAAAARFGARWFRDVDEMAASGAVEAVDICTPSGLHAGQGLAAARRGLHVLCEKPLDLIAARAGLLVDECERRDLTLACIFQRRTYRGARQVARMAADGQFGRVVSCSAQVKWWRSQSYYDSAGWRGTKAMDGGVLANQAVHALDHMCWLAGPVAEVEYAHLETAAHDIEAEDTAIAVLRFESGARGVIEATTCCSPDLCTRLELYGTRGSVAFDDAKVVRLGLDGEDRLAGIDQDDGRMGGGSVPMAISSRGHEMLLADFAAAVRDHRDPLIPGRQGLMAVQALDMIYAKAAAASAGPGAAGP